MSAPSMERRGAAGGLRAAGRVLSGYAASYNDPTAIGTFTERIAPGAFIVTSRPRDTWNDADLIQAVNLARTLAYIELMTPGSDEHAKLTRLAMALARAVAVHPTATVGRAADMVGAATAEREARQQADDELIPRLKAI